MCTYVCLCMRVSGVSRNNDPRSSSSYLTKVTGTYQDQNNVVFNDNMNGVNNPIIWSFTSWPVLINTLYNQTLAFGLYNYQISRSSIHNAVYSTSIAVYYYAGEYLGKVTDSTFPQMNALLL